MKMLSLVLYLVLLSNLAISQEAGDFLDQQYQNLIHPEKLSEINDKNLPASDTKSVIRYQSQVRSQSARGTCSIFASTAYIEGLLIKKGLDPLLDLSEEWLEYVAVRNHQSDGSSATNNFSAIKNYGMPLETHYPYIGEDWLEVVNPLKEERCGKLTGFIKKSCLIVHRDPTLMNLDDSQIKTLYGDLEFINARQEALEFKNKNLNFSNSSFIVSSVAEAKKLLQEGMSIVLEIDFFYGAWNHRKADEFGIGRNLDHWEKGIVTSPEKGSVDMIESLKHPAGHSIVIVGYDDEKTIEKTILMADGTSKTFTYKGVYYFKNSWGTYGFGRDFDLDGEKFSGYGMIAAQYAENFGQFFKITLL